MAYLHGTKTEITQKQKGILVQSRTIIGIIGTSDIAIDEPILISSISDERLGEGTIKDALGRIRQQAEAQVVAVSYTDDFDSAVEQMKHSSIKATLFIAPELADIAQAKKLEQLALELGGVAVVESSGTDLVTHKAFAEQLDNSYVIAGGVDNFGGSATAAGVIARNDAVNKGVHVSPSNKRAYLVSGSRDKIAFISGKDCLANQLNENGIACFVNQNGKCLLWGSRLANGRHIQKYRTEQFVTASIAEQTTDAIDQNMTGSAIQCLVLRIEDFLNKLQEAKIIASSDVRESERTGENHLFIDYSLKFFDSAEQITYQVEIK